MRKRLFSSGRQEKRVLRSTLASAVMDGDHARVLLVLVPICNQSDDRRMEAVEQAVQGAGLPPVADFLLSARLELTKHPEIARQLPSATPREVLVLLPAIDRRIKNDLQGFVTSRTGCPR